MVCDDCKDMEEDGQARVGSFDEMDLIKNKSW
jgi:hypothetical protein